MSSTLKIVSECPAGTEKHKLFYLQGTRPARSSTDYKFRSFYSGATVIVRAARASWNNAANDAEYLQQMDLFASPLFLRANEDYYLGEQR